MAYSDFRDKLNLKREEAELKFRENSEEAWGQIKRFITDPTHWIVFGIVVLLFLAGFFTVKFFGAIRAPELPSTDTPVLIGDDGHVVEQPTQQPGVIGEEPLEEIDDSNTVQPILTGARKEDFYTFLLVATDAFSGSTDTLMVVSYDVKNQQLNLMSIPRDTMVNVSWDLKKINSVYAMSGINGLKRHISKLIGFVPDYYVKVDLKAFIETIDLIGGVDFDVPRAMNYDDPDQNLHIHFQPGMQHLTGQQAMEVVRWRKDNRSSSGYINGYDDTGRIQTQQAFLRAALKQALSIRNWTKITGYVEIFNRDVDSDLELGNMLWFARQAMDLSDDGFYTCTLPGDYYAEAWSRSTYSMQSYVTLYPQQVISLVNEKFNPYLANVSMSNLDIMSISSDGSVRSSTGYVADSIAAMPPNIDNGEDDETENPGEGEGNETGESGEEGDTTEAGENGTGGSSQGGTSQGGTSQGGSSSGNTGTTVPPDDEGGGEEPPPAVTPTPQPPSPTEPEPTTPTEPEPPAPAEPQPDNTDTTPDNNGV
ncbi:MAG: transcriptional regulator [Ruminococcaceae bacterium]|nr:transcriptional regulator [Oscillospiraceae bacterium]